jgi:xanthine dehydrogenase small subunit
LALCWFDLIAAVAWIGTSLHLMSFGGTWPPGAKIGAPGHAMDDEAFVLTINGAAARVAGVPPTTTLLQFLRAQGWTSVKEGCAEGDCGACTVAVVEAGPDGGAQYRAVVSCLLLLPMAAGLEVWTAEGIAAGGVLHPVQAAMVAHGGSQCGYCTPGFVMSLFAEHYRPEGDGAGDEALVGNLCRCTGYLPIRAAARSLGEPTPDDPFLARLHRPGPGAVPLSYAAAGARFERPGRLDDAVDLLVEHPEARLVAGATDLGLEVSKHFRGFPVLIALDGVAELQEVRHDANGWEIGAGVTLSRLEEEVGGALPVLGRILELFASRQIRNRATVGGNLVSASPIGDLAPVLLALEAELCLAGPLGERRLPVDDFFTAYRQTALLQGELLVSVRIPDAPAPGAVRRLTRTYKVAKSPKADISTVAAAFVLHLDAAGTVLRARLGYGGVAPTPVLARGAQAALEGRAWDAAAVEAGRRALVEEFQPISDLRGSARYRRLVVANLLDRFFEDTRTEAEA